MLQAIDSPVSSLVAGLPRVAEPGRSTPLVVARDAAEFLAAPIGRCIIGSRFAMWCAAPDLVGTIQWGVLDEATVREMIALAEFVRHRDVAERGCLIMDCRDVDRVDADALLDFTGLAREQLPAWSRRIARQAVVVPGGLPGILLSGALPSLGPAHPHRFVPDLDAALAFIDHPGARAAHAAAAALALAARGRSTLVTRLRARLSRDLVNATVEDCATALALSVRTLQRELRRQKTSFSDELRRVRVAVAEELLIYSDLKIDAIANRVGLGTSSRMSATLRRELSVTASELRSRARARAATAATTATAA